MIMGKDYIFDSFFGRHLDEIFMEMLLGVQHVPSSRKYQEFLQRREAMRKELL